MKHLLSSTVHINMYLSHTEVQSTTSHNSRYTQAHTAVYSPTSSTYRKIGRSLTGPATVRFPLPPSQYTLHHKQLQRVWGRQAVCRGLQTNCTQTLIDSWWTTQVNMLAVCKNMRLVLNEWGKRWWHEEDAPEQVLVRFGDRSQRNHYPWAFHLSALER